MQCRGNALVAAGHVVRTREYNSFDTLFFSRLEYVPSGNNVIFKHRLPGVIGIGTKTLPITPLAPVINNFSSAIPTNLFCQAMLARRGAIMARGFSLVVGSILVAVPDDFRTYHTE